MISIQVDAHSVIEMLQKMYDSPIGQDVKDFGRLQDFMFKLTDYNGEIEHCIMQQGYDEVILLGGENKTDPEVMAKTIHDFLTLNPETMDAFGDLYGHKCQCELLDGAA